MSWERGQQQTNTEAFPCKESPGTWFCLYETWIQFASFQCELSTAVWVTILESRPGRPLPVDRPHERQAESCAEHCLVTMEPQKEFKEMDVQWHIRTRQPKHGHLCKVHLFIHPCLWGARVQLWKS